MTVSPSPAELLTFAGIRRAAIRHKSVWFLAATSKVRHASRCSRERGGLLHGSGSSLPSCCFLPAILAGRLVKPALRFLLVPSLVPSIEALHLNIQTN